LAASPLGTISRHQEASMLGSKFANLFKGSSGMHAMVNAYDWNDSAVGQIEQWPETLRTAVSICLESRFPIWIAWGREDMTMFYNDAYVQMLATDKHPQFFGRSAKNCWHEIWDVIGPLLESVFETGEATLANQQFLLMNRSGFAEETYFTYSYSPIKNDLGEVLGMFCACHEDTAEVLTNRRSANLRALSGTPKTVEEAAAFCASIFQKNPSDIPLAMIFRSSGNIFDGKLVASTSRLSLPLKNEIAAHDIVGRQALQTLDEIAALGKPCHIDDIEFIEAFLDSSKSFSASLPSHMQTYVVPVSNNHGQVETVVVFALTPYLHFDERYRGYLDLAAVHSHNLLATAAAFEVERQKSDTLANLAILKDERASELEVKARESASEALKANEELRTLARLVSEQVQEPAVIIASYLKLLSVRFKGRLDEDADEFIDKCTMASRTVNRMVDDLWHYVRVDSPDTYYAEVDVSERINRALRTLDGIININQARITHPHNMPAIVCNADQLEHLFTNLTHNAIKYKRADVAPTVEITCENRQDDYLFCVEDNGIGIDPMHSKDIFKPFVRLGGRPDDTGTGMGLAVARKIVNAHGGEIWVESNSDQGSRFFFTIAKHLS
jgi:signal transduction histidine kinase